VTADGSPQRIVGRIKVEIEYANVKKCLPIYIVPLLPIYIVPTRLIPGDRLLEALRPSAQMSSDRGSRIS